MHRGQSGTLFCGKACQTKAWKNGHKKECKRIVKENEEKKESGRNGGRLVSGKGGESEFMNKDGHKMNLTQLGVAKRDQLLFATPTNMTEGQARIVVFGSMENYLTAKADWQRRATSDDPLVEKDMLIRIYRQMKE